MNTPARLDHRLARGFLRAVAPLSDGLSLCFAEGLTSGRMLEYIYENRPRGRFGVGVWLDARFLAAPGWQAVRERRAELEVLLEQAIRAHRATATVTHVLDIASGPAGYLLAVLARLGDPAVHARARDLEERWLARGRERAAALGLANLVFERGDALDPRAFEALSPRPDVVVASGFYDWITDDALVQRSLALVHAALPPGGSIVLTHQVANPALAFLNAVFTDFHHAPLQMKMRPAATVHGWLDQAGFRIEQTRTDRRRFYAITLARRV